MEPAVPGGAQPLTEDTDILTVVDDFESIYDVPFVTVNRIGNELLAEVMLSGTPEIDEDRLAAAQSVAWERGYRAYARVFGDLYGGSAVTIHFTDAPTAGTIWALAEELGADAWSQ